MENGALHFKLFSQFRRIYKVSVVRERHSALYVVDHDRLTVKSAVCARRAVADVAYRHIALAEIV